MRFFLCSSVALCGASLLSSSAVGGVVSSWIGPPNGLWNVPASWSNGVPGLGVATEAVIQSARPTVTVTLNMSPVLESLTLGAGTTLVQPNNFDVSCFALTNNGLWTLASTGATTDLLLTANASFAGTGAVELGGLPGNRILGVGVPRTLTNGLGHTIRGGGLLGVNNTILVNHGTVEATLDQKTLLVDAAPGWSSNDGLFKARDGGMLTLQGTQLDNANGTIVAMPGGHVILRSSTIKGGFLESDGDGTFSLTYEVSNLEDITTVGTLLQPDNADCTVAGTITNLGVWSLQSDGASTEIQLNSPTVTLAGTGSILLSDATTNRIFSTGGQRTLHQLVDHSISGGGQLGVGNTVIVNEGLIEATTPVGLLVDCAATPTSSNLGLMRARDGSQLIIHASPIENEGGVIRAEANSSVLLRGSTISHGLLETVGNGEFLTSTTVPTLVDLTIAGNLRQPDGADVYLLGTITNDGQWRLEGDATLSEIQLFGDVSLLGTGQLQLAGTGGNRIHCSGGNFLLRNGAEHTIVGGGELCWANTKLANDGVIEASGPDPLTIDTLDTPASQNAGWMRAAAGGTLTLHRSTIENTGHIVASPAGTVVLRGSTVTGGVIAAEEGGLVLVEDTNAVTTLDSVHVVGEAVHLNGAEVHLRGTWTNDGTWHMQSIGTDTDLLLESGQTGTVSFLGTGTLELSSDYGNRVASDSGIVTLINGGGHSIRGAGRVGIGSLHIDNQGSIEANQSLAMTIDPPGSGMGLANHGTLRAAGSGGLVVLAGPFTNDGTIVVELGSNIVRTGSLVQSGGVTTVNGAINFVGGGYSQSAGLLAGDGALFGPVSTMGGSVSPSGADGSDIGSLAIYGDYSQTMDGGVVVDLGLSGNDLVTVGGTAHLGGALQVRLVDPFVPLPGQEFTVLSASAVSGHFDCIEYPHGSAGYFHVVYGPQTVKLVVDAIPTREADLDFDGAVGASDLAILLGAWGEEPCNNAICCPADLNGDGKVNATDLATLLGDWG